MPPEERSTANLRPQSNPGAAATTMAPPTDTTSLPPVADRKRGLVLVVVVLAVLGVIATAVVIASSRRGSRTTSIDAPAVAVVVADARIVDAAVIDDVDAVAIDAPELPPDAGRAIRTNPAANEHLKKAEDAFRKKDSYSQLVQADLALKADPRNARAKFLYGDALIKYNRADKGCRYLRMVGKTNPACGSD